MKRNLNVYAVAIAIVFGSPIAFANNDTINQNGGTHNGANVIQNHGGGQNGTPTPPHGTVNGTLGQTADQDLSAQLTAQQKLNAENNATQAAVTKSGDASTTSGPAYTKSGDVTQRIDGSAGGNTLKSTSEGGMATLNGKVEGVNHGNFQNDGRQSTTVNAQSGDSSAKAAVGNVRSGDVTDNSKTQMTMQGANTRIGPVSSTSRSEGGKGGTGGVAQATGNGSGNSTTVSTVTVDKRIEVPVMFNPLPPTITTSGGMETRVTQCGPLMHIVKTPVKGTHVGIFINTSIDLGQDMELAPVYDENGQQIYYKEETFANGVTRLFGSQAIITTALPQVTGASTLSIGFAGASGGVNSSAGSSSAMSRIVTKVIVSPCEIPGAYMTAVEKRVVGLTKEDLKEALAAELRLEMYTDKVVTKKVPCKVEEFTDATGKKVSMCRGPNGSYEAKEVTREKAVGTARTTAATVKK